VARVAVDPTNRRSNVNAFSLTKARDAKIFTRKMKEEEEEEENFTFLSRLLFQVGI
jgi:hypothetical protein